MREFYKKMLEELESLTGIRQYFYLQSDPNGKDKIKIVIDGMVEVSKKFNYIPEKYQQQIIRKMITEDQNYDAINSRVIWRWLELHKNAYSQITEEELTPEAEPATDEQVKYWTKLFFEGLEKIGNPQVVNGMKALRESKGYQAGVPKEARPKFIVGEMCPDCKGYGYFDETVTDAEGAKTTEKDPCESCDMSGKINRCEVFADNQEEAQKAWEATFN